MVVLEKRETRQISFFVRGLKAGGPVDSSNLVNERVNYDEVISVDLASTRQGFQISVLTDRIEVKFFVHEDWRAQDAVDSLSNRGERYSRNKVTWTKPKSASWKITQSH
jgi:hypothetical protein